MSQQNLQKETPLEGSPFTLRIENYWPDFRLENGKPTTLSEQPDNPAVVVTLRGHAEPVAAAPDPHGAPAMPAAGGDPAANHLTLFVADDGVITYDLASRKLGHSTGKLEPNTPLATGWADWQLTVDQAMQHAMQWMDFIPVAAHRPVATCRMASGFAWSKAGQNIEQWIPAGWQVNVPTAA